MNQVICTDTPTNCDAANAPDYRPLNGVTLFEKACKDAGLLAAELGEGWVGRVWENGGWHFETISPCRRINVYPATLGGYHAMLHAPGEHGMPTYLGGPGRGKTPKGAVKDVVNNVKARIAEIQKVVESL